MDWFNLAQIRAHDPPGSVKEDEFLDQLIV